MLRIAHWLMEQARFFQRYFQIVASPDKETLLLAFQ
ncbi:hypothetical protein ABID39_001249 [Bartonella japonica]|uniref:Uncharacterized protein n=1 Tax=Bartonella japonica TaxID=357761 RepID=A0ABV2FPV1_9HYPH